MYHNLSHTDVEICSTVCMFITERLQCNVYNYNVYNIVFTMCCLQYSITVSAVVSHVCNITSHTKAAH